MGFAGMRGSQIDFIIGISKTKFDRGRLNGQRHYIEQVDQGQHDRLI